MLKIIQIRSKHSPKAPDTIPTVKDSTCVTSSCFEILNLHIQEWLQRTSNEDYPLCHGDLVEILIRIYWLPQSLIVLFFNVQLIQCLVYSMQIATLNRLQIGLHQRQMSCLQKSCVGITVDETCSGNIFSILTPHKLHHFGVATGLIIMVHWYEIY